MPQTPQDSTQRYCKSEEGIKIMISWIRELLHSADNHMDMFDALNEKVDRAFNAIKKNFGW